MEQVPQWTLRNQFQKAIKLNDLTTAKYLLNDGIDSDICFGRIPALCISSKHGSFDLVRLLLEHGCSVNQADESGLTALHYACNYVFIDIARLLIVHRANVNAVNYYGFSPLHLAVQHQCIDLVQLLVESGALIEKRNMVGETPLLIACKMGNYDAAQYLLTKGANVNVTDKDGNTPLLIAIYSGLNINTQLVKLLLNAGADSNQANKLGWTPLLITIQRSSEHSLSGQETVQALIDNDCDINAPQYCLSGEDALNLSITRQQDAITEKLIRSGAKVIEKGPHSYGPVVRLIADNKNELAKMALAISDHIPPKDLAALQANHANIAATDPELHRYLFVESFFPKLKQLSRAKLRAWYGRKADKWAEKLQLPSTLRKYLLLQEL